MIHLDTSFVIRALATGSPEDRQLRTWLTDGRALGISTVAWTELLCGPLTEAQAELLAHIISSRAHFTEEDAALAARLFNETGRRRGSLADCMIAAAAANADAPLATTNAADFRRFETAGLQVIVAAAA